MISLQSYLQAVSSGSLIYALDPDSSLLSSEEKLIAEDAILNILIANRFDSIPLINIDKIYKEKSGEERLITKIARRRYHDGDVNPLTIVSVESDEIQAFSDGDLLSAIIQVLGNEHHIAMIGTSVTDARAVISIDMLKSELTKDYLCMKFAEVSSMCDLSVDAARALLVWNRICDLAEKVKEGEGGRLPSDEDVTEAILSALEPLQIFKSEHVKLTEADGDKEFLQGGQQKDFQNYRNVTAHDVAEWPMACVVQNDKDVAILAAKMLNWANDFTNVLYKKKNRLGRYKFDDLGNIQSESPLEAPLDCKSKLKSLMANLTQNGFAVCKRESEAQGIEFGIISENELCSWILKYHVLVRFSRIETMMKSILKKSEGKSTIKSWSGGGNPTKKIENLSFGQVWKCLNESDKLGKIWKQMSADVGRRKLLDFRNDLVHQLDNLQKKIDLQSVERLIRLEKFVNRQLNG